ncbi:MAG: methyltransferase domain-containing protein [Endomicrobium sp.]|nr:methyltransferase domain-containing protein [Endomicrobium sp.]
MKKLVLLLLLFAVNVNGKCLICESNNVESKYAHIADFVQFRIYGTDSSIVEIKTSLIHCKDCGFAFYKKRFNEDEERKLYDDYRGESYQKLRQKYETWYTKEFNYSLGNSEYEISLRTKHLLNIVRKRNLDIKSLLDFGGDKGQFIPDEFNCKKYVYEISGIKPKEGIISLQKMDGMVFDFIMCAHVLEHVSDPKAVVLTCKAHLVGGGIYI